MARANWGLSFSCLKTLYTGVFIPMVLYSVGAWVNMVNDVQKESFLSAQRQAIISISHSYRTTSIDALQVICGVLPLDILARDHYFRYMVRVGEAFT